MEFIIELLNLAEKQGVLTGGKDKFGNWAFVVLDSKSIITVCLRPTGRATIVVRGDEQEFNLEDEVGEGPADFMAALSDALIKDNLDHKAVKLGEIVESMPEDEESDEDEDDSDEDSDSEDSDDDSEEDSDEEDSSDDDDEEESDEDADESDDSDDESDEEEVDDEEDEDSEDEDADEDSKPTPKKSKGKPFGKKKEKAAISMDAETADDGLLRTDEDKPEPKGQSLRDLDDEKLEIETALTGVELSLMRDNVDSLINNMIETADEVAPFNPERFIKSLGGSGQSASYRAGAFITVRFTKTKIKALELALGTGKPNTDMTVKTANSKSAMVKLLRVYADVVKRFGTINNRNVTAMLNGLTKLIQQVSTEASVADVMQTCKSLVAIHGKPVSLVTANGMTVHLGAFDYEYTIVYNSAKDGYILDVSARGGGTLKFLAQNVKVDTMVGAAAVIAKLASTLQPDAPVSKSNANTAADVLMERAIKLGYAGSAMSKAAKKPGETAGAECLYYVQPDGRWSKETDGRSAGLTKEEVEERGGEIASVDDRDGPQDNVPAYDATPEQIDAFFTQNKPVEVASGNITIKDLNAAARKKGKGNWATTILPKKIVIYSIQSKDGKYRYECNDLPSALDMTHGVQTVEDIQQILNYVYDTETAAVEVAYTKAQVIAECKKHNMIATLQDGEWRVTFPANEVLDKNRREAMASYCNDPEDAIATAKAMRLRATKHGVS